VTRSERLAFSLRCAFQENERERERERRGGEEKVKKRPICNLSYLSKSQILVEMAKGAVVGIIILSNSAQVFNLRNDNRQ
jgi:hypothetical protein